MGRSPAVNQRAYSVTCRWAMPTGRCSWGVARAYERDAWDALSAHLLTAHGHDVHAEKERTD